MILKSTLKITDEFNNCPGGESIITELTTCVEKAEIVDVKNPNYPNWENDAATLVVGIPYSLEKDELAEMIANMGMIAGRLLADEFNWRLMGHMEEGKYVKDYYIFRLWWD